MSSVMLASYEMTEKMPQYPVRWITTELARRCGLPWTYGHPSEVFAEMKASMKSLNNITWDRLESEGAVTYPSLSPEDPGQAIVFGDRFHPAEFLRPERPNLRLVEPGAAPSGTLGIDPAMAAPFPTRRRWTRRCRCSASMCSRSR